MGQGCFAAQGHAFRGSQGVSLHRAMLPKQVDRGTETQRRRDTKNKNRCYNLGAPCNATMRVHSTVCNATMLQGVSAMQIHTSRKILPQRHRDTEKKMWCFFWFGEKKGQPPTKKQKKCLCESCTFFSFLFVFSGHRVLKNHYI